MGRYRELDRPVAGIVAAQLRSDFAQLTDKDFLHLRMEMGLGLLNEDQLDYRRLHRSTDVAVEADDLEQDHQQVADAQAVIAFGQVDMVIALVSELVVVTEQSSLAERRVR